MPSQSNKPPAHAYVQTPAEQPGVTPNRSMHGLVQDPQFATSCQVSISHPFAGVRSQSTKPGRHVKPQAESTQVAVAEGGVGHGSQVAQWSASLVGSTQSEPQTIRGGSHGPASGPASRPASSIVSGPSIVVASRPESVALPSTAPSIDGLPSVGTPVPVTSRPHPA